jgi:short-subunit dehydrogenase
MVQATISRWDRIDVLVNNAGMSHDAPLLRIKPEIIREEIHFNLFAVIECTQAVLLVMLQNKSGQIINICSIAGLIAPPGGSFYSATKLGVIGFSDALRRELKSSGIQVSIVCPGYTPTELSPVLKAIVEGRPAKTRPLWLMPVTFVVDQIAHLVLHPRRRAIIPAQWKFLIFIAFLIPSLVDTLIPSVQKLENY